MDPMGPVRDLDFRMRKVFCIGCSSEGLISLVHLFDRLWTFRYLQLSCTLEFNVYTMEECVSEDECRLLSHAEERVQAIRWAHVLD